MMTMAVLGYPPTPSASSSFLKDSNPCILIPPLSPLRSFVSSPPSSLSSSSLYGYHSHRCRLYGCSILACLPSSPRDSFVTSTKLYVSGLSFRTTERNLRNAFQNYGQLQEVNLVMDKIANRPRGFAFLRYATEEESKKAIEGMHGKFLDGRVIFVEIAKPRTRTPPRPAGY